MNNMAKVDISLLKELRKITNAPLKDCKSALIEANWDLNLAQDVLKKAWAIKAAKKAGRDTNEWIVRVKSENWVVVWVKLACETDFVAKNEQFIWFADKILDKLLSFDVKNISNIKELSEKNTKELNDIISETVSVVWENVKLLDVFKISWKQSYIYNHPWNKIVWIVLYKSNNSEVDSISKELALQAVAMDPEYVRMEDIPKDVMNKQVAEFREEVIASWKPENIADNIVKWKTNKYFSQLVLLEQWWIRDETKKMKTLIPDDYELLDVIRYSI